MSKDDVYSYYDDDKNVEVADEDYLRKELQRLVGMFGLAKVHHTLRSFPGYCSNCGCPIEEGEQHSLQGIGMCITELTS